MGTLIYKLSEAKVSDPEIYDQFSIHWWRPGLNNFIPPGKGKKYFAYWLFHYLGIFRNKDYGAVLVKDKGELIASLLVVPAHFKWPFMAADDLQFTYVLTSPEFRGKGIGGQMLHFAIKEFQKPGRTFWYVTDTGNISSQRLAEKRGFKLLKNKSIT